MQKNYDVIIIGAGAAGLMAAGVCTKRGKKTLVLEHSANIGDKIRISGGGRCNFTNIHASPKNYISANPDFVNFALSQYSAKDFIKLVKSHNIAFHEKTLGQLFCDNSSKDIINMLLAECKTAKILTSCKVINIEKSDNFTVQTSIGNFTSTSLIIATGGLSIPKMGATDFGYKVAKKFGLNIIPTRPALVPLTTAGEFKDLSGISIHSIAKHKDACFKENILFTHRGLSGPAILQISSYMEQFNNEIYLDLLPEINMKEILRQEKNGTSFTSSILKQYLPNRFVEYLVFKDPKLARKIAEIKLTDLDKLAALLHNFPISTNSSEGYAKAEVTVGGVDTNELDEKTMESKKIKNLYFIGEVVDVTGWLGGYNFQWAWASGYLAGRDA